MDVDKVGEVARAYGVQLLIQFGSTVTGRAHTSSDLDLGVLCGRADVTLDDELALGSALQGLFTRRELDLVVLDRADPLLLNRVATEGRLLWGSRRRYYEWKMYAYRRYQEYRPYLDMERTYLRRQLGL